jgi:hypothetical protein
VLVIKEVDRRGVLRLGQVFTKSTFFDAANAGAAKVNIRTARIPASWSARMGMLRPYPSVQKPSVRRRQRFTRKLVRASRA